MLHSENILLVAYINSHLPELLRVAKLLKETGRYEPTLCFSQGYDIIKDEWVDLFRKLNIRIIDQYERPINAVHSVDGKAGTRRNVKGIVTSVAQFRPLKRLTDSLYRTGRAIFSESILKKQRFAIEHLLREQKVKLIVLCEDNAVYVTGLFTSTGRKLSIPSVIVPYTIANSTEAAEHAYDQRRHWVRGIKQRSVVRKYPQWACSYKGQSLLLLSSSEIIAQEKLGLAPPNPWILNNGFANSIAAESHFMVRYYKINQIPEKKLVLTGALVDDILKTGIVRRTEIRSQCYHTYALNQDLPLLLCAFPPPWFPRPACDFSSYRELVDFWLGALNEIKNYNVILNLHPAIGKSDREYIATKGLPISSWDISQLIPIADLYVANISATIRWAIACGLPVINYDVYKYRFHDYDTAPGVISIESKEDFVKHLRSITTDRHVFEDLQKKQATVQKEWGMLDGQSGQRMLQLFERLITHQSDHQ